MIWKLLDIYQYMKYTKRKVLNRENDKEGNFNEPIYTIYVQLSSQDGIWSFGGGFS